MVMLVEEPIHTRGKQKYRGTHELRHNSFDVALVAVAGSRVLENTVPVGREMSLTARSDQNGSPRYRWRLYLKVYIAHVADSTYSLGLIRPKTLELEREILSGKSYVNE
jgi:hypothetical protein